MHVELGPGGTTGGGRSEIDKVGGREGFWVSEIGTGGSTCSQSRRERSEGEIK